MNAHTSTFTITSKHALGSIDLCPGRPFFMIIYYDKIPYTTLKPLGTHMNSSHLPPAITIPLFYSFIPKTLGDSNLPNYRIDDDAPSHIVTLLPLFYSCFLPYTYYRPFKNCIVAVRFLFFVSLSNSGRLLVAIL